MMRRIDIDRVNLRGLLWKKRVQAARELRLHPNTLAKKLKGESDWMLTELNALADFAKVDIDQIVRIE